MEPASTTQTEETEEVIQGLHYLQYDSRTPQFISCNLRFENQLVRLYRIFYKHQSRLTLTGNWVPGFFHCTGNCSCLVKMAGITLTEKASTQAWCSIVGCPIQSILKHGFSMCFENHGGHYFSTMFSIAKKYGLHKDPAREILAVLICMARDIHTRSDNKHIRYVKDDEHIIPYYLALVRV